MDQLIKLIKKISVKGLLVHLIGLIVSMSIIWGVSYLILITFSIQDSVVPTPIVPIIQIKAKTAQGTSTKSTSTKATSTKSKQ